MAAVKGIIFDMDNTLLRSRIDFKAIKRELFDYLTAHGIVPAGFPVQEHTSSTLIAHAQRTGLLQRGMQDELWAICARHEREGMKDAELEPGAHELLGRLHTRYALAVLTNNSFSAAQTALTRNGIGRFFDHTIGREQAGAMKPAPDGIRVILNRYQPTKPDQWLSVGDAWIDGKASQEAGVRFIAYQGDTAAMNRMGVHPAGFIGELGELERFLL